MKTTPQNQSQARNIRKQQKEQRRIFCILAGIILFIFACGTIFGCFLCSVFASDSDAVLTEQLPEQEVQTELTALLHIESDEATLDKELQTVMLQMCEKYQVPFALAVAVAEQESHFNPDAVSSTNDYGMMQINTINFKWLREKGIEPLDYDGNIEAGILILSEALKRHDDVGLALMAYNCGDAGAKRLWNKGVYSTKYSSEVLAKYEKWNEYITSQEM